MDVPVPQIAANIPEVFETIPTELSPERIVEQIDDFPFPRVATESLDVEIDDGPVQHVVKDIFEVLENNSQGAYPGAHS